MGDFCLVSFLGDMFSCIILAHANMASWDTVRVWLLVLCAGPLSWNVSAYYCLTSSASFAECRGGSTLGGVPILFYGTKSAGNFRFGFTLEGGDGFSMPVDPLGGVKGGTGGQENNGGVGKRCGAGSPLSYLSALFSFIMLPSVVSCSSVVLLRCSRRFLVSSCDILSTAAMTRSSGVTSGLGMYLCLWNNVP